MDEVLLEYIFRRMVLDSPEDAILCMIRSNEIIVDLRETIEALEEKLKNI